MHQLETWSTRGKTLPHFQSFENVQFVSSVKFVVKSQGKFCSSASVYAQLSSANPFWPDGQKPKGETPGLKHEWESIHMSLLTKLLSPAGHVPLLGWHHAPGSREKAWEVFLSCWVPHQHSTATQQPAQQNPFGLTPRNVKLFTIPGTWALYPKGRPRYESHDYSCLSTGLWNKHKGCLPWSVTTNKIFKGTCFSAKWFCCSLWYLLC